MPNKAQEAWYLTALRRALPDCPDGETTSSERPDFLVVSEEKTVGLEFTLFHLPPSGDERPHQETQALKERAVARAAKLHDEADGRALYVSIFFLPRVLLSKRGVDQLARAIAGAVSSVAALAVANDTEVEVPWQVLPREVAHVIVRRSINGTDKLWHADAGGWVAEILPEHIREVLQMKFRMHAAARQRCDELWLVIVNDLFSRAAQAELPPSTADALFDHPFGRLLWLIPHVPKVVTLKSVSDASYKLL